MDELKTEVIDALRAILVKREGHDAEVIPLSYNNGVAHYTVGYAIRAIRDDTEQGVSFVESYGLLKESMLRRKGKETVKFGSLDLLETMILR